MNATVNVTDLVSLSSGLPYSCGNNTFTITDTPAGGVAGLSTKQLAISSLGVISVQTTNALTVGKHTIKI